MTEHYLEPLFAPQSVALIGASERPGSLGRDVLENLLRAKFAGELYPVNPKRDEVLKLPCARNLVDLRGRIGRAVDLAIIVTPAAAVPSVIADCERTGIKHAVILAGGFGEVGPAGRELEGRVLAAAHAGSVRLIGPNCLGIMRPSLGLDATFSRTPARAGPLALVSQSGAICTALVDWAWAANIGFSSVISMGAAIDVDVGEILDYLLNDPDTHSILMYLEGVRNARRFVSALRAAARVKPIVVVKVGRHTSGAQAVQSHTGALVGSDAVFDAVLRRCGAVRVAGYSELFAAAQLLATDRLPLDNRLAIITNGGGPGVLAADAASDANVRLAQFGPATMAALDAHLPANWSRRNPADILGDAPDQRFAQTLATVLADPDVDGVLTLFCPQALAPARATATLLLPLIQGSGKPVLTAWLGEYEVRDGREVIESAGMPAFSAPEAGVQAFGTLTRYRHAQQMLLEVPPEIAAVEVPASANADKVLDSALADGRTLLNEVESKALLACFGIPTTRTIAVTMLDAAQAAARSLGFPVALKILSPDITHKSEVDGVRLNIRDATALKDQYESLMAGVRAKRPDARIDGVAIQSFVTKRFGREVLVGLATDPVFGPIVTFGAGGIAVELLADFSVALPPLSASLADSLIDQTRVARLLRGYRHIPAANRAAIVDVLLRVSAMAAMLPWITELDINPLLVDDHGAIALDARVIINGDRRAPDRRYSHMAIHPYPTQLERVAQLRDGSAIEVRPIRPEDAMRLINFVSELSDQSRYYRFFTTTKQLVPKMLARLTQVDYDRELALIAVNDTGGLVGIIGVVRYTTLPDGISCEFAVTIADLWHGRGMGTMLMRRLIEAARDAGLTTMTGQILAINDAMIRLARQLGFDVSVDRDDAAVVTATLALKNAASTIL